MVDPTTRMGRRAARQIGLALLVGAILGVLYLIGVDVKEWFR